MTSNKATSAFSFLLYLALFLNTQTTHVSGEASAKKKDSLSGQLPIHKRSILEVFSFEHIPRDVLGGRSYGDERHEIIKRSENANTRHRPLIESDKSSNDELTEELRNWISTLKAPRVVLYDNGKVCDRAKACVSLTKCQAVRDNYKTQRPVICNWENDIPSVCCPSTTANKPIVKTCGRRGLVHSRNAREARRSIIEFEYSFTDRPRPDIVGGTESDDGDWPWMGGIYTRNSGVETFRCGGTIANEKHIITAAHCFDFKSGNKVQADRYVVRVGSVKLGEGTLHEIEFVMPYPQYKSRVRYNDIAVIRLKKPIRYGKYVQPICLPKPNLFRKSEHVGRKVTVSGWGHQKYGGKFPTKGDNLREVTIPLVDLTSCDKAYADQFSRVVLPRGITKQFVCAGVLDGGKDACQFDSGGPLMMEEDRAWTLVGVVSFGHTCGTSKPAAYTRVTNYLEWLEDIMES